MNILGEHIAEIALRPDRLAAALTATRAAAQRPPCPSLDAFIAATPRLSWQATASRADRPCPAGRHRFGCPGETPACSRPTAPSCCPDRPMTSRITSALVSAAARPRGWKTGLARLADCLATLAKPLKTQPLSAITAAILPSTAALPRLPSSPRCWGLPRERTAAMLLSLKSTAIAATAALVDRHRSRRPRPGLGQERTGLCRRCRHRDHH